MLYLNLKSEGIYEINAVLNKCFTEKKDIIMNSKYRVKFQKYKLVLTTCSAY